jgi:hypothetical protein
MLTAWQLQRASQSFYNTTGETIPPYACMELDYFNESGISANEITDGHAEPILANQEADQLSRHRSRSRSLQRTNASRPKRLRRVPGIRFITRSIR